MRETLERLKEESTAIYYLVENPLGCLILIVVNAIFLGGSYLLIKLTLDLVIGY